MSQFTIDVLELAVKQGRAVTNSTMFSLAIAESSLNKRGPDKKSYDAAVVFAASMQPHLLDEWVRACYANEKPLSLEVMTACRRSSPSRSSTRAYEDTYKAVLRWGLTDNRSFQIQQLILENLVAETYEILEKEKA